MVMCCFSIVIVHITNAVVLAAFIVVIPFAFLLFGVIFKSLSAVMLAVCFKIESTEIS